MRKEQKTVITVSIVAVFITAGIFLPGLAGAEGPEIPPTWSQILPADDGDGCNSSRFECVMGGEAVLDKETGLTWARNGNLFGTKIWVDAVSVSQNLTLGNRKGWRLPTKDELASLIDMSHSEWPRLPAGHPFLNVQPHHYWTSTEYVGDNISAWYVSMFTGYSTYYTKGGRYSLYVWPVRGGNR